MKKFIYTIIVLAGLVAFSCSDYLEELPRGSVTEKNAIKVLKDCETAVNGLYARLKHTSYYGSYMTNVPNALTDETLAISGFSNTYGPLHRWQYTASSSEFANIWTYITTASANACFLLERIDGVSVANESEAKLKQYYKGQAYLARAIFHFDLVRFFAKTYNPTTASTDLGVPITNKWEMGSPARATVEKVYEQILIDADSALKLITIEVADGNTTYDGYFTKGAINAFLARVYLTMGDWNKAIEYSTKVISSPAGYALSSGANFKTMFLDDKGTEIIWKVKYNATDATNARVGYIYYDVSQSQDGKVNADYMPTTKYVNLYDKTNDVRFSVYFRETATKYGWTGNLIYKYPTNPLFAGVSNGHGVNMAKVFRLGEQYLIRAEAYSEKNTAADDALALADLNTLRKARITGYTDASGLTGNALKSDIAEERLKELAFEGQRWFDLKRKGQGFTRSPQVNSMATVDFIIEPNNHRWVFPIPQAELNGNSNMVQNPNY